MKSKLHTDKIALWGWNQTPRVKLHTDNTVKLHTECKIMHYCCLINGAQNGNFLVLLEIFYTQPKNLNARRSRHSRQISGIILHQAFSRRNWVHPLLYDSKLFYNISRRRDDQRPDVPINILCTWKIVAPQINVGQNLLKLMAPKAFIKYFGTSKT